MNKVLYLVAFAIGAGVGSFVTLQLTKKYYADLAQGEIDSVKEAFSKKSNKEYTEKVEEPKENEKDHIAQPSGNNLKPDIMEYASVLREEGYTKYSNPSDSLAEDDDEDDIREEPYIIDPDDFAWNEEYEKISLTHFADGVLADDGDKPIEDVDNTVGGDYFNHFGEYEEDVVYVRNDKMRVDFEICRDLRTYKSVLESNPHLMED